MSIKNTFPNHSHRLLLLVMISLTFSGCEQWQFNAQTYPILPSSILPSTPKPLPARTQPATDPYRTWDTNFKDVTDLAEAGIAPNQNFAGIDTANVHSGGKSIKVFGTIGSAGSGLSIGFGLSTLAGKKSFDLSEKTLNLEMYLPEDSPVFEFFITVFGDGGYIQVRLARAGAYKGKWHTYSVDIRQDILLKSWRTYDFLTSPGLTDSQAVFVLQTTQQISVMGLVQKERAPAESYFLVDRLGWEPSGPPPVYDPNVESLRKYAELRNLPLGGFMEPDGVEEPEFIRNLAAEFNTTLAWNIFPVAEPPDDAYAYDESWNQTPYADYMHAEYGYRLIRYGIGQSLEWVPAWLPGKNHAETKAILESYTRALVDHWKGKTYIWILFNELMRYDIPYKASYSGLGLKDRNQTPQTWESSYSPLSDTPSDVSLIEDAFRAARAADPDAMLFINDAAVEEYGNVKAEAFYKLVARLKADGTPIDGVGFQGHITLHPDGNFYDDPVRLAFDPERGFTGIAASVERFRKLGLKVVFTEVDISIYLADIDSTPQGRALLDYRHKLQAAAYRSLVHIALTHDNVAAFTFWGWTDQYSSRNPESGNIWALAGYGDDLGLFDWFYRKKASYDAVLAELKG